MIRFFKNIFLPGISIASLLLSIGEVCREKVWFMGFIILGVILLLGGGYLLHKKLTKNSVSWVLLIAGLLILVTLGYSHHVQKENAKRSELWSAWKLNNWGDSEGMTDLQKSAIHDNDARSQYLLAYNYVYGKDGYGFDFGKGKDFAQQSADQGNPMANALLAIIYSQGYGVQPNYQHAFSNIILSIKGGNEEGLSLLPLLDRASFKVSSKDSLALQECIRNGAFLDSLYDAVITAWKSNNKLASFSIVQANKDQCTKLSDMGYHRAADLLYFEAIRDSTQKEQLHHYAKILKDYNLVPDMPTMRHFFLRNLNGEINYSTDKELVEAAIKNQDYWYSVVLDDYDKSFIHDLTYRYEYDLAFYKRSKYLLANKDSLSSLFFVAKDDLDHVYANAWSSLYDCTAELKKEMLRRPFVFDNTSSK